MSAPLPFPSVAPYRIDQVMAAPITMSVLFVGQLLLACLIGHWARRERWRCWWLASGGLVASVMAFFTLASWGTSDPAVLSHHLAFSLNNVRGEPFWMAAAPLIVRLPWRMSLVHGLVVSGYAALAILLARHWRVADWGGWWALLLCCSPMLRYFLQNGVSRQALVTLLLVPMLLWAGRLARPPGWLVIGGGILAATVHTAYLGTLAMVLLPRALVPRTRPAGRTPIGELRLPGLLLLIAALALMVGVAVPMIQGKLSTYLWTVNYFNGYPISPAVQHLQLAMALGVLLTCWRRRLGPRRLLGCANSRVLLLFTLLYGLLQQSIASGWLAQIAIRFADPVGLFLLLSWLAWLVHHRCLWAVLPALLVTLDTWLIDRLVASHALACGRNDEFLCVPDRWPWQLRY